MTRRPADLLLSASGWIAFNVVVVWTAAFLAGEVVGRTVDGPARVPAGAAVVVDVALLALFAVQHSVMARRSVKERLRPVVPERLERTVYVLATDAVLALLLVGWQPFGGSVWHLGGAAAVLLWGLCAAGWALAVASTYAVDHLELTGLRQAGWAPPRTASAAGLEVGGLHAVVRHPLMTGLLLAFWATPRMSASHLLFAVVTTGYVALGVHFEECDLRRTFGSAYEDYAAAVPAVLPGTAGLRRALSRVLRKALGRAAARA
ncbi:MAG: methyltransferase family protein [Marmoricola sp.]